MAGAAILGRLSWLVGRVTDVTAETPRVRSIHLEVPGWPGHWPGQHVDIRLTAEDGYQAQRSYSIANAADGERVVLTVERVEDGEVSPFLFEALRPGDRFELRGPIGGYFVWSPEDGGPLQLIGGGSGIVPLMAMIRVRGESDGRIPTRLLYSARAIEEVIYLDELGAFDPTVGVEVTYTLTRARPDGWAGFDRRVDRAMLEEATWPAEEAPFVFVCGPTGFVETVATALVSLGHPPERVRTERFGPTGGTP